MFYIIYIIYMGMHDTYDIILFIIHVYLFNVFFLSIYLVCTVFNKTRMNKFFFLNLSDKDKNKIFFINLMHV